MTQPDRARTAFAAFLATSPATLDQHARADPEPHLIELLASVVREVPAYRRFLAARGVDPSGVRTLQDFQALPLTTKDDYVRAYPLGELCRGGLAACDTIAVSSGSTGEPAFWPRFVSDELAVAARFEQVFHDSFEADRRPTLAVVCFPLGTWVGGMFTTACLRHLAAKGYPLMVATPGNQKAEILRVTRALGPQFAQTVLCGYPPFLKEVIDDGAAAGIAWADHHVKLVLAGEVVSEAWRELMAQRAGLTRPLHDSASLYGTADGGVLGNETPVSIAIRRFLATRPAETQALFGQARLPTLVQYDPLARWFEALPDGTLAFSGDNGVPLIRYHINDAGGVYAWDDMLARLHARGFDPVAEVRRAGERGVHPLPFVYLFGRAHFAVSYYGANVFPEMVALGLEQPALAGFVTGKFVMQVREDAGGDSEFWIDVELGAEPPADAVERVAAGIAASVAELSSEYRNYVPPARQLPRVRLWPKGHPDHFPVGVKHRYSRK